MPCSGRSARGSVSYRGPPTAPSSTASARLRELQRRRGQRIAGGVVAGAADRRLARVSIGRPSLRSASSTLRACATISGPMPSPGRIAIFIGMRSDERAMRGTRGRRSQPRLLAQMPRLERADLVGVLQREADLVQPVQQAVLAERIDVEVERQRAVGVRDASARSRSIVSR